MTIQERNSYRHNIICYGFERIRNAAQKGKVSATTSELNLV